MKLSEYFKLIKEEEVARRYFVVNTFDGALTILGIVIAIYFSGNKNESIVITSSLGAAVAIAVSGIWGAYAIERAERLRSLRELERHLMRDLDETELERRANIVTIMVAMVDGLSPLLTSLVIITPFFASKAGLMTTENAFLSSFILVVATLFLLGAVVGKIAKENIISGGVKMAFAGLIVGILAYILEYAKII